MSRPLCEIEMREHIRSLAVPTQKALAGRIGIGTAFLCDVLSGNRPISSRLAELVGYERVVTFRKRP